MVSGFSIKGTQIEEDILVVNELMVSRKLLIKLSSPKAFDWVSWEILGYLLVYKDVVSKWENLGQNEFGYSTLPDSSKMAAQVGLFFIFWCVPCPNVSNAFGSRD